MSMRKFPRVGVTAAGALAAVLAASAFAAAPLGRGGGVGASTGRGGGVEASTGRGGGVGASTARGGGVGASTASAVPGPVTAQVRADVQAAPLVAKVQPGGPITATGGQRSAARIFASSTTNIVSNNWGGYVAGRAGVRFRYVQATFFVPYLDCTGGPVSYSGHWVGLDGLSSSTVEQDGILAACSGSNPQYSAWYEMFPLPPVYSNMSVRPGNSIVASVYYNQSSRAFTLKLTNTTTGASFTATKMCPGGASCERLTAEAISEAPSSGTSILPLSNFRAESFSDVVATSQQGRRGGLRASGWNTLAVTTESAHGTIMDQPTSIAKGKAFACYWISPG